MKTQYMVSSAQQFLKMLRDVEPIGVKQIEFNRCPRFAAHEGARVGTMRFTENEWASIATRALQTPDDVVEIWSVHCAKQRALVELYVAFGLKEARAGRLDVARDVGLWCVGHITLSEPRAHLLLGQAALGLHDRALFDEAKAFLKHLHDDERARALDRANAGGAPDFSPQTFA
jgi:hypothetical protein